MNYIHRYWIKLFHSILCFCVILSAFSFLQINASASERYRDVDTFQKVYDYADLLSDSEEETLRNEIYEQISEKGYDIFIVTIDDNNVSADVSDRSRTFIEDFGDYNNFGMGDDYVALLIDMDNREIYMDVRGETCFSIYTDDRQNQIMDLLYEDASDGEFNTLCFHFIDEVKNSEVDTDSEYYKPNMSIQARLIRFLFKFISGLFGGFFLGMIISGIVTYFLTKENTNIKTATEAGDYISKPLSLIENSDQFIRSYETRIRIKSSSSSGSSRSSHSSHTSTHRSSSGRSHSGSGRHF